ncbi:MAG: hypothetical protein GXP59_07400 [Deltaproteobacteria bacterium]|nr:hypothetical protein [Deltaproteobacteria bacterium]
MSIFKNIDVEQLIEFIFLRYKEDGGFAAFPSLPSTIEDTFYAVDMVEKLHRLAPNIDLLPRIRPDIMADFIKIHSGGKAPLTVRLRYYLDEISRICGLAPYSTSGADFRHEKIISFAGIYYLTAKSSIKYVDTAGGTGLPPIDLEHCTCKDVYYNVLLHQKPDLSQRKMLVAWLKKCQNYDGGFGFYPGTTSFIENCDYCLTALSVLADTPFDMTGAARFILACQCAAGGFSRNIRAVPFLESTWHATNIFSSLNW